MTGPGQAAHVEHRVLEGVQAGRSVSSCVHSVSDGSRKVRGFTRVLSSA
jgi:hypothetical protein